MIHSSLDDDALLNIARLNKSSVPFVKERIPLDLLRSIADAAANQAHFDFLEEFPDIATKAFPSLENKNDDLWYWLIVISWVLSCMGLILHIFFQ